MTHECGGCRGLGAHWRWCEVRVGHSAAMYGRLSEEAESLGDRIGANLPGAANAAYRAASALLSEANRLAAEFQGRDDEEGKS